MTAAVIVGEKTDDDHGEHDEHGEPREPTPSASIGSHGHAASPRRSSTGEQRPPSRAVMRAMGSRRGPSRSTLSVRPAMSAMSVVAIAGHDLQLCGHRLGNEVAGVGSDEHTEEEIPRQTRQPKRRRHRPGPTRPSARSQGRALWRRNRWSRPRRGCAPRPSPQWPGRAPGRASLVDAPRRQQKCDELGSDRADDHGREQHRGLGANDCHRVQREGDTKRSRPQTVKPEIPRRPLAQDAHGRETADRGCQRLSKKGTPRRGRER